MTISLYIIIILFSNILFSLKFDSISKNLKLIDYPDEKIKIHKKPIPLLGGVLIFYNILIFFICLIFFDETFTQNIFKSNKSIFNFFFLTFTFFLIGYVDDRFNITPNKKFLLFILTILIAVLIDKNLIISKLSFSFTSKEFFLENFSIFFTVLCIVLFVNAFNMFDGINCQTGLYSLFIFFVLLKNGQNIFLITTFLIPLIFFLFLNYNNKTFLGNSGSYMLPIVISQLLILPYNQGQFFSDEILLILLFPGLDMLRLFIFRLIKNKNPFKGDKNHLHHLITKKIELIPTLFLTIGFTVFIYVAYIMTNISMILFLITIVFYYLLIYFFFKD
jgi:UDP-GlcNAc:undecaprenyl-phosphate GlcNAc-1-phosphate transferase